MVRLERQGDSFVFITSAAPKQDVSVLIQALSELQKNSPDIKKIKEGLLYLDSSAGHEIRKEIKDLLLKAINKDNL